MLQRADRVKRVGFDKQHILSTTNAKAGSSAKAGEAEGDEEGDVGLNKMGGMNLNDLKYLD